MTKTLALMGCLLVVGCDPPPPIKTSSGTRVEGVSYQETFARSENTTDVTFHGDRLRKAVELMDKHGLFDLKGPYEGKGVLDSATLVIVVELGDKNEKRIGVKNCAESHVCAFMTEAVSAGVVERLPVVCKQPNACK